MNTSAIVHQLWKYCNAPREDGMSIVRSVINQKEGTMILGDQIEINLIRAIMTDANPWLFLTRPISGSLLARSVASLAFSIWQHYRQRAKIADEVEADF